MGPLFNLTFHVSQMITLILHVQYLLANLGYLMVTVTAMIQEARSIQWDSEAAK